MVRMPAVSAERPNARRARTPRALEPPLAFASARSLSAVELRAAPVRLSRPSRLLRELQAPSEKAAAGLRALAIGSVGELIEHVPERMRAARTIAALSAGEQATVAVRVNAIERHSVRRRGMRPLVQATVADESGTMRATFFNQPWLADRYVPGTRLLLHGTLRPRRGFAVSHHALLADGEAQPELQPEAVAHYAAADGVSSTQILTLVRSCRDAFADVLEPLPAAIRVAERLPERAAALAALHFPAGDEEQELARRRLAFEELLLSQLALRRRRHLRSGRAAVSLSDRGTLSARWIEKTLPFALTDDQREAIARIDGDLAAGRPMQRLLMGEVGSGKTVVALYAMLRAVEHGRQAALMAPTETLAVQHFATLHALAPAEMVSCALLTGSTPPARRRDLLGKLASGELKLLVGTHALIERDVSFAELAVVVVDEQHRFGVRQRTALAGQAPAPTAAPRPHELHMTATPIPRTLALMRYGDLDVSRLRQLPAGRRPIVTRLACTPAERTRAYERLREELRAGRQAFVVCPLVEESEQLQARAAQSEHERLSRGELAEFRVGLLHGQMRPRAKQETMAAFAAGEVDVLVATTVIEVGIDVPNATVMLVEDAERYGISQLHQLRGRIGRGPHDSLCVLFGPRSSRRLQALVAHSDGFELAEIDLRLRGATWRARGVRRSARAGSASCAWRGCPRTSRCCSTPTAGPRVCWRPTRGWRARSTPCSPARWPSAPAAGRTRSRRPRPLRLRLPPPRMRA